MGRTLLAAICGALLAVGVSAAATPEPGTGPQQERAQRPAPAPMLPPDPEVERSQPHDSGCPDRRDDRNSDLCAQWKAADAANESAVWTGRVGIMTGGGLLIGALTLLAAVAAAKFARDAARETKRSADLAESALRSLERPYLVLEIVKSGVERLGKKTTFGPVEYRFKNLGRSPAILTRRFLAYRWSDGLPAPIDPTQVAGEQIAYGTAIAPGRTSQKLETGHALPIISIMGQNQTGEKRGSILFLIGFIRYRDLAGNEHVTGFCFGHDDETGFHFASPRLKPGEEDPFNYDRRVT